MKKILTLFLFLGSLLQTVRTQVSISGVVNTYTEVTSLDYCANTVQVISVAGFSIGDRVLIIQMKGADANLTNTASFGNINAYNDAGNYEFGTIASITGTTIGLENSIERTYDPAGSVQLIRVAVYNNANVDGVLTASNWNGTTGGVLVMEVNVLTLNADIDLSGKGFRGGDAGNFPASCPSGTGTSLYYSDTLSGKGGEKGEGIVELAFAYQACRGKAINGGGGGNDHNAGAGGGGNGALGGVAGENDEPLFSCPGSPGHAGLGLDQTMATDKIFLGGGGGAGHGNNTNGTDGGNGGGIVIIRANQVVGNSHSIFSNGESVTDLAWGDGAGGGGAGGSILIVATDVDDVSLVAKGGKGGDTGADQCTGPGGGGSGGVVKHSGATLWPGITTDLSGGIYGTNTTVTSPCYGLNNGAATGTSGTIIPSLIYAESNTLFNPDFAFAGNDTLLCDGGSIKLEASGGVSYLWSPSTYLDNPFVSDPNCDPLATITYVLQVTNAAGCIDFDTITISVAEPVDADAGDDVSVCEGGSVTLNAGGGISYLWSPGYYLDDNTISNPVCTPLSDIIYTVIVTDANGCVGIDSVFVDMNSSDFLTASDDATVCGGGGVELFASGGVAYLWSPSTYLDDATSSSPICTPDADITYYVTSISAEGCEDIDTVSVFVSVADFLSLGDDVTVCEGGSVELNATGGITYTWSPSTYLDDPFSANPLCTPDADITYYVTSINADGCEDVDTISILLVPSDFAITDAVVNVCPGTSVGLNASGGTSYLWSPSTYLDDPTSANPICTPVTDIIYFVSVGNGTGCTDIDTVAVNLFPEVNAVGGPDTVICSGEPLKLHASGGVSYLWTPDTYLENDTVFNPNCYPEASISYIVFVTDINGCTGTDTVDIIVNESPVIDVSDNVTICRGDTTTLTAVGGTNYLWTPEPALPCDPCESIDVSPTETTEYIVQGFDANGCFDSDTVTVTVEICQGIEDELVQQIKIYPNPAGEMIYISAPAGCQILSIELLNLLGEQIHAIITGNHSLYQVQLPELPAQEIMIRVNTNAGYLNKMIVIEN